MRFAPLLLAVLALCTTACFQADTNDDEGGEALRCEDYCSTIADSCQDGDEQYATDLACMNVCELMTPGQSGDAQGNTLGCRMTWSLEALEKQGEELAQTCRWAGPGGDGTCGGVCESLCDLALDICAGDNAQWASATECISECNMLPEDPRYNTAAIGANRSCRLFHLTLATANPVEHCPHVGGAGPCAP
ncbi:hypothetical protein ACNOYE_06160 [Nannocystaceae bacterium ST9]